MLELKNIYKTFNPGTINEKRALNGLNLKLNEGVHWKVLPDRWKS